MSSETIANPKKRTSKRSSAKSKQERISKQSQLSGELIKAGAVYNRTQVMKALGWGRKTWTSARSNGMKVIKVGSRLYVMGEEVLRYMKTLQEK